ncbi:MAG: hypothetical protein ABT940_01470 [Alphaproteobacteria bacterium]
MTGRVSLVTVVVLSGVALGGGALMGIVSDTASAGGNPWRGSGGYAQSSRAASPTVSALEGRAQARGRQGRPEERPGVSGRYRRDEYPDDPQPRFRPEDRAPAVSGWQQEPVRDHRRSEYRRAGRDEGWATAEGGRGERRRGGLSAERYPSYPVGGDSRGREEALSATGWNEGGGWNDARQGGYVPEPEYAPGEDAEVGVSRYQYQPTAVPPRGGARVPVRRETYGSDTSYPPEAVVAPPRQPAPAVPTAVPEPYYPSPQVGIPWTGGSTYGYGAGSDVYYGRGYGYWPRGYYGIAPLPVFAQGYGPGYRPRYGGTTPWLGGGWPVYSGWSRWW